MTFSSVILCSLMAAIGLFVLVMGLSRRRGGLFVIGFILTILSVSLAGYLATHHRSHSTAQGLSHDGYHINAQPDGTMETWLSPSEPTVEDRVNRCLAVYDSLLSLQNAVYGRDSLAVQGGVYNRCGYVLLEAIQVIEAAATGVGLQDFVHLADLAAGSWAWRYHKYEKYRAVRPGYNGRNRELLGEMSAAYVRVLELGYGQFRRTH